MRLLFLLLTSLCWLANGVQADVPFAEKSQKVFNVRGRPFITVKNPDGNTILESNDGSEVRVEVTKEVRHAKNESEAKKVSDRVTIRLEQTGNRIEIEAIQPHFNLFHFGTGPYAVISFHIIAPKSSDLDASGADGKMDVHGFDGDLKLSIADGDLTANDLTGRVKILGADGNLRVTRCSGTVEFGVSDGDLEVEQCSGKIQASSADGSMVMNQINGTVDAKTSDGKLQLYGTLNGLTARASDGQIDVHVNNGSVMQNDWFLKSSDGDILLYLPDSFSADLDISTSDGHIETHKPILIQGSVTTNKVIGKLGSGGHTLQIHTSDGDIQLLNDGQ